MHGTAVKIKDSYVINQ